MNKGDAFAIPTVETERLLLRPFSEEDLEPFAAINADADTMQFIGTGVVLDRAQTWRAMASFLGHWRLRGYGIWAVEVKATGEFIGRTGLFNPEGWPGLEAGWLLDRRHWGQGFATEAGAASIQYAWDHLGAERVISLIRPANHRSIRVAEKLGERLVDEIDFDGPALVYAIDRP